MSEYPYCEYSMGLYLTGLRANLSKQRDTIRESGRVLKGKFILGLGTGRSGSTTLTHIFAAQKNTYCSHEHPPIIDWRGGERQVSFHLERMEILAQSFAAVVDVSHWWLPKLKSVVHRIPGVRVVIIKRDRAGTIGSFTRIKGGFNRQPINHWMEHDGIKFQYNLWDACYPKYDANSLDEALGYYWDDYYATAEKLQSEFPFNVRIFNLEELSSELGQREILEFCDFEDPVLLSGQKFNKGTISDGASLWGNPFEVSTTE